MDMDNCVEFAGGRGSIRELNGNGKYAIKIKSTPPKMHGYFKWIVMMILFPLVKYLGNFYTHIHLVFKYIVFNLMQESVSTNYYIPQDTLEKSV